MPFTISDIRVTLMSSFGGGYFISRIGGGESHCLVTNRLGKRIVIRIGSLPFLGGPARLCKFGQISGSPGRHWISVLSSFSFAGFRGAGDIQF